MSSEAIERAKEYVSRYPGHEQHGPMYVNIIADLILLAEAGAKLPCTADGVRVVPGMLVWAAFRDGVMEGVVTKVGGDQARRADVTFGRSVELFDGHWTTELEPLLSRLFSTRAAAEQARRNEMNVSDASGDDDCRTRPAGG